MASNGWVQNNLPELFLGIIAACVVVLAISLCFIIMETIDWVGQHESVVGLVIVLVALALVAVIVFGDQQNRRN